MMKADILTGLTGWSRTGAPAEPQPRKGDTMDSRTGSVTAAAQRRWAMHAATRMMAFAALAASLVSVVAVLVAAWALTRPVQHRYFATRASGELVELTPLNEPHRSNAQVVNFAVEAVTRALTLDFANYRRSLADVEVYFTPAGWKAFLSEIQRSGSLELIRNRRMVSTAVANGAVVLRQGIDGDGVWTWQVEMPLKVTYQSSSESQTQDLVMVVEIKRTDTWATDSGVAVSRLVGQSSR